jgi:hypothetical protein
MENTHTLIWLFADDLFHQILFYFGTVVAMGNLDLGEEEREAYPMEMDIFFLSVLSVCIVLSGMGRRASQFGAVD